MKLRNLLQEVYFGKTVKSRDMVTGGRPPERRPVEQANEAPFVRCLI